MTSKGGLLLLLAVCVVESVSCRSLRQARCTGGKRYTKCGLMRPTCEEPYPAFDFRCMAGCFCPQFSVENSRGQCIRLEECEPPEPCTGGQIFRTCSSTCSNPNCQKARIPMGCPAVCMPPKCECPYDKPVFEGGVCITREECD